MGSIRVRAAGVGLFALVFALLAQSALASHFRYGYINWERVLDYVPSNTSPNTIKVKVEIEAGLRWNFSDYPLQTVPGHVNPLRNASNRCEAFGLTSDALDVSCPPVGSLIAVNGGGRGVIGLEKIGASPLTVLDEFGNTLTQGQFPPVGGQPTGVVFNAKVTQVIPSLNTMYAKATLFLLFDPTATTVRVNWAGTARLSTLRDGNNDQNWRVQSLIDLRTTNPGITKSPKSTSFPLIPVLTNALNTIAIPSVAFDNLINKYRLATSAESLLVTPTPPSLSLNQSAGTVTFTPPSNGLYAAQFIITSYDPTTGLDKVSVPLDLIFEAAPGAAKTVALATGDGLTTYTATVQPASPPPTPFTFTVRSTLQTADATYIGTIANTPLPAGATFTTPACNGGATCVGTFSWVPTVNSTGSVVCFSSSYNKSGLIVTSSQLCVNIKLAPLATTLTAFEELDGAAGGGPLTLKARLTRTLDDSPLAGRPVVFSFVGDPNNPPWVRVQTPNGLDTAITDGQGFATLVVTSTRAVPTPSPYSATFNAVANEFLESSSAVSVVASKLATTSLNAPTTFTNPFPSVGHPLPVSVVLKRHFTDGGEFGVGAIVNITLTAPTGTQTVAPTAPTNSSGSGIAVFPAPVTTGLHTASAYFAGNDALFGDVTSPTSAINVRQRTQVTMSAGIASQNVPSQVQAVLVAMPANTPLAGRTVKFSAAGITDVLVQTDASGIATAMLTFTTLGAKQVTASYTPAFATELNRHGLEAADFSNANIDVQPAQTTAITIPTFTGISGRGSTLTATLKTAGNAPVQGATVNFSIVGGASLGSGVTLADGTVSVAITPGNAFSGQYRADFAGIPGYAPSNATANYVVNRAATSLAALTVNATDFVGNTLMVSTVLTRTDAPAGALAGETVAFTLAGAPSNPGGATTQTVDATTDASGQLSASFVLAARGQFHLTANFAATAALNASARNADVVVYQKTSLLLNAAHGIAGGITEVSAGLQAVPGNAAIAGETVHFDFGGVVAAASSVTNAAGVAQVHTSFPAAGSFQATASFSNPAAYYVDQNGQQLPSTSTATATIALATSHVANVTAPATALVGQSISLSTVVTRTSAPEGPVVNAPVTFTIAGPGGSTQLSSNTNALGQASVTYLPAQGGVYGVTATYAGDAALVGFTSAAVSTTVTHPTTLAVSPATGFAGRPLTLTATLLTNPGNWGVAGQNVTFTFTGPGAPAPAQGTTDGSGVATVTPVFATPGTFTATASFSNAPSFFGDSSASAAVTATNTAPTITDLPNINLPATSSTGRHIDFTSTGNDAEDGALTPVCNASSGTFPIGSTLVTCTVTDIVGATASDSFTITITNNAPTFTAPTNISLPATSSQGRQVTFSALGSDVEDGSLTADCQARSGETFPLGTTTIACTVTDAAGATASGSFSITITNSAPTIAALPDVNAPATSAAGRHVDFASTGSDFEDGALIGVCTANPGTFPIGTTEVSCTVTDVAGATASDSFTITITNNAPTFTAPTNISMPATSPQGRQVTFSALGSDVEDGSLTADCQARSGETFPLGTTTLACTVTDVAGAAASGSFSITITNTAPTITDLPDISEFATSAAGRHVDFASTGSDFEDGALIGLCTANPGTFPIGTTEVSCTVTDVAGATATDTFSITITNSAPTITDLPDISEFATSAAGRHVDFASTGDDNEDGPLTGLCTANPGTFPIGTTSVTCTVTDVAGVTASDSFSITIKNNAPTFTAPTDISLPATSPQGRQVTFSAPGSDIEDGSLTADCQVRSAETFPLGTTTIACTVTDSLGLTASDSFDVVITNTAPTIVDLPDITGEATSAAGRTMTFDSSGDDAEDGALTPVCTSNPGTFPIGATPVTCTVTDVAGFTATDSFTVTVQDTTKPDVSATSITVEQTSPAGAVGNYAFSATDIVDGTMTPTCTPASGTTFARGTTDVSCTATDAHNNTGSATATVTVVDTIKPVVTYTGNAGAYTADQIVNITCAATDSGSGVATTTCADISGPAHTFAVGVNNFSATATDVAGNTNSAAISFTMTVPPSAVGNVITQFFDSASEAAKANQTLNQATSAPNASARAAHLNKLVKDIEKEIGKTITAAEAATLIALIQNLY
jgi:hypothetical protein